MMMDAMYHHQHKCFHLIVLKHENDFHAEWNVTSGRPSNYIHTAADAVKCMTFGEM